MDAEEEQLTVTQLGDKIARETELSGEVFEGRRIAELIHEHDLGGGFLATLGEAVARTPVEMPSFYCVAFATG